jgi:signal transduction histidine kinase
MAFDQMLAAEAYHIFIKNHLEQKVREANEGLRAKNKFIASMSHELRTPLNSIIGFSDLLKSEPTIPVEQVKQFAETIHRNGNNLLVIVDDVLELAKANSGTLKLHVENRSLDSLRDDLEATLDQLLQQRQRIQKVIDWPNGLTVETDCGKLRQILVNLVSNAAKFTEQGSIAIRARRMETHVEFSVTDTGCGIPPELHQSIFGEFVQGRQEQRIRGIGLGLAICRVLSSLLHAKLELQSSPGEGACFRVVVPLAFQRSSG